jgi:hypothetical protein
MKRKSIIFWGLIILFIFFLSLPILAKEQVSDFRKTNWGMSKEEVKEIESLDEISSTLPIFITTKEFKPKRTYTIQIGTFSKEEDAQNLAKEMNNKGYQTNIVERKSLYNVQVGEFKSYEEAQRFSNKLKNIEISQRNDLLLYQDHIFGFECSIYYCFLEDKLYQGLYLFNKSILNEYPRIKDYEDLKELLIKKYEEPTIDTEEWKDDLAERNELSRETAINKGCLVYTTGWETLTTKISIKLYGIKNKNFLQIIYSSKELEELMKQKIESAKNDKERETLKDF